MGEKEVKRKGNGIAKRREERKREGRGRGDNRGKGGKRK